MDFRALLISVMALAASAGAQPGGQKAYIAYVEGPSFGPYWSFELADHAPAVDPARIAYNRETHEWFWDGAPTCVGWGEFDAACDATTRVCASADGAAYGHGSEQINAVMKMVNLGLTTHPDCPTENECTWHDGCSGDSDSDSCAAECSVQCSPILCAVADCPAHADARCHVDACGGCSVVFTDAECNPVDCASTDGNGDSLDGPASVPVPGPAAVPVPSVPVPIPTGVPVPVPTGVPVPMPTGAPIPAPTDYPTAHATAEPTTTPDPTPQPEPELCVCTTHWAPVCGVDNVTYGNDCNAACAHQEVACEGECPCVEPPVPSPTLCGCPEIYMPVCGEDGVTYPNECEAGCADAQIDCRDECPCGATDSDEPTPIDTHGAGAAAVCADPHDFSPEMYINVDCDNLDQEACESMPMFEWDGEFGKCERGGGAGGIAQSAIDECVALGGTPTHLQSCQDQGDAFIEYLDDLGFDAANASTCLDIFAASEPHYLYWFMFQVPMACCGGLSHGSCGRDQMICEDNDDFNEDMLFSGRCAGIDATTCEDLLDAFGWEDHSADEPAECNLQQPTPWSEAREECESVGGMFDDMYSCGYWSDYLGFEANREGFPMVHPNHEDGSCDALFDLQMLGDLTPDVFSMYFGHVCCNGEDTVCSEYDTNTEETSTSTETDDTATDETATDPDTDDEDTELITVCHGEEIDLSCPESMTVHVTYAFYGRAEDETCPTHRWDGELCEGESALSTARHRCRGKNNCTLRAAPGAMGGSPCPSTEKYLQLKFDCVAGPTTYSPMPFTVPAPVPFPAATWMPMPSPSQPGECSFDDGCSNEMGMCGPNLDLFCMMTPCMACAAGCPGHPDARCFPNRCDGCEAVWLDEDCQRVTCDTATTGGDSLVSNVTVPAPMPATYGPAPVSVQDTSAPTPAPVSDCGCLPELDYLQLQIDALSDRLVEVEGRRTRSDEDHM